MSVKFSPIWERMFSNAGLPVPAPIAAPWPWPTSKSAQEKKRRESLKMQKRGAL